MVKFLFLKYLSLALNASRSLILAAVLGPASYGVLGTLVVVQQYLSYAALGMREALTVRLAQAPAHGETSVQIHSSALAWGLFVGAAIVICLLFVDMFVRPLGAEWLWVGIISLLSISNEILINIARDQGKLAKVALLEIGYNAAPLACVLFYGRDVTVLLVLQSIAAGLVISVLGYLNGVRHASWRQARMGLIKRMLIIGIPLAIASFFSASVTSIYVLVANAMHLGKTIGLIVFANSVCSIVLFGSNMVAWAATSKSMKRLAVGTTELGTDRNLRLTWFFRIAVLASSLAIILSKYALTMGMPAYLGAEQYALFFCLLQAYSLLLYVELNFLAVRGKTLVIVCGYGAMLGATLLAYAVHPSIGVLDLVGIGIVLSMLLGIACVVHCRRLGLHAVDGLASRLGFLAFPTLCALSMREFGSVAAALVAMAYLGGALVSFRQMLLRETFA